MNTNKNRNAYWEGTCGIGKKNRSNETSNREGSNETLKRSEVGPVIKKGQLRKCIEKR